MTNEKPKKPGKSERTRGAILAAAQTLFAERGFERTSVRDIAAMASIDPALVIRYFGGKDALFALATDFDIRAPDLAAVPPDAIGETLVRHFLNVWESDPGNGGFVVLLRSAASNDYAADRMRKVFATQVLPALTAAGGDAGIATRAGLVSSQLLGLALGRYILKLPPLVAMSPEQIVSALGPTIQRYASGADPA